MILDLAPPAHHEPGVVGAEGGLLFRMSWPPLPALARGRSKTFGEMSPKASLSDPWLLWGTSTGRSVDHTDLSPNSACVIQPSYTA